jgi:hypothetical protein
MSFSLRDGLVGAWVPELGATGARLLDQSGRGNHGTLQNGPTWETTARGTEILYDGVDQYTDCGSNVGNFSASDAFSAIVWVTPEVTPTDFDYLFGRGSAAPPNKGWRVSNSGAGNRQKIKLQFTDEVGTHERISTDDVLVADTPLVYVATYDGGGNISGSAQYVNGEFDSGSTVGGALSDVVVSASVSIGARSTDTGGPFNGNVSAMLWDRVLTPSEIQQLYIDPLAPFTVPDQLLWYEDEIVAAAPSGVPVKYHHYMMVGGL